jgi:uncharacterized protein (DUF1499 family)
LKIKEEVGMRVFLVFVVLLFVAGLAYVRLAPSDPSRWHVAIAGEGDADFAGGALRSIPAGEGGLAAADAYMRGLPRTQVLAGSVAEGLVTYVTRSKVFGFPDYTTIELVGDRVKAYARLRFGQSDMGVNAKRLEGLVAALEG